jgi:hypothetical protein
MELTISMLDTEDVRVLAAGFGPRLLHLPKSTMSKERNGYPRQFEAAPPGGVDGEVPSVGSQCFPVSPWGYVESGSTDQIRTNML